MALANDIVDWARDYIYKLISMTFSVVILCDVCECVHAEIWCTIHGKIMSNWIEMATLIELFVVNFLCDSVCPLYKLLAQYFCTNGIVSISLVIFVNSLLFHLNFVTVVGNSKQTSPSFRKCYMSPLQQQRV